MFLGFTHFFVIGNKRTFGANRNLELILFGVWWRGLTNKFRIEVLQGFFAYACATRKNAKIYCLANRHHIIVKTLLKLDISKTIRFRVQTNLCCGDIERYIVTGFFWQIRAHIPIIRLAETRACNSPTHSTQTAIIRRQCQMPIAKFIVEVFQVTHCCAGGFFRVAALVLPIIYTQAVHLSCGLDKLP